MSSWQALDSELDAWAEAGRCATLWWRDDDAAEDCPALEKLLNLAETAAVPLVLAVIPAALREAAVMRINNSSQAPNIAVVQHGYAHTNHARDGEKKIELGGGNPAKDCRAHLHMGQDILVQHFGARLLPVLVPPWNRIDPALVPALAKMGYAVLSTYGARESEPLKTGPQRINCHIDILNWRQGAVFLGEPETLELACAHLRARRLAEVDADEPTGLLSHHLQQDAAAWQFLADFFKRTLAHPAAAWPDPATLFGAA
ncbi:MAG: hypothetical protein HN333_08285 [Rhodospirillaceae bacterium]|nr:hypothetical protein [Rhodospirillaceae bacterium]